MYSGGLGLLQNGVSFVVNCLCFLCVSMSCLKEADVMALDCNFPLETDDFGYSQPVQANRPQLGSYYNTDTPENSNDIFDMIYTFNKYDWMAVLSVLVLFYVVLKYVQKKVYGIKEPRALWIVTMFFMGQDFIDEITLFLQVFSCVMSFFSFFVMQYLMNSMSTDLSTVDDPKAIDNYDRMIEYGVQPVFMKGHPEIDKFRYAVNGLRQPESGNRLRKATTGLKQVRLEHLKPSRNFCARKLQS